jgi:RNA polymerase sigma-70 factor (ECF subfamily)
MINKHHLGKQPAGQQMRSNKMGFCCVDEIDKRHVTSASVGDPGTDEALVAAAKDGDEQAFGVLIERHHRRILTLALRYVRVREDAEDTVQQTFQKTFVNLHRFKGKSSFSTWLTRIAINEALMLLRRGRMLREVSIDEASNREETSRDLELSDLSPDPEASCLRREAARILSAAMHKLTPPVRTVIELRELGGLSTQETALRMGLSVAAVKARVFHGRRKLRKTLESLEITTTAIFRN